MRKSVLIAGVMASAIVVSGVRVYADDAVDDEGAPLNSNVSYDNTAGYDANGYPIVTAIGSQPGFYGGHTFTGWAVLDQDQTGSMELFVSQGTLTNLVGTPTNDSTTPPYGTPTTSISVGMALNVRGAYSPFDGIPEITFNTTPASNHYIAATSVGNALPTPPVFTISGLQSGTGNGSDILTNPAIAGMYLEIQDVTISPTAGNATNAFATVFPKDISGQNTVANESYIITDGGGSTLELFDWTTSYSTCAAMGGSAVPTGPVDIYGFYDSFNEFVPLSIVPEPSTFMLAGVGLIGGLLAMRRRRS